MHRLTVLCVLLLAGCGGEIEQTYQGETQSHWLAASRDNSALTRATSVKAIASFGNDRSLSRLREMRDDPSHVVRRLVAKALTWVDPSISIDIYGAEVEHDWLEEGRYAMLMDLEFATISAKHGYPEAYAKGIACMERLAQGDDYFAERAKVMLESVKATPNPDQ